MPPDSPCTKICTLDAAGVCIGCLRTVAEIASWVLMTSAEQWQLVAMLEERKRRLPQSGPGSMESAQQR